MQDSLFSIRKSPETIRYEEDLAKRNRQRDRLFSELETKKRLLAELKTKAESLQREFFRRGMIIMETCERLRKEICGLCQKAIRRKGIPPQVREEIKKVQEDFKDNTFERMSDEEFRGTRWEEEPDQGRRTPFADFAPPEPPDQEKRSIRKVFLDLAARFHPDKARTDEDREHHHRLMVKINEAYERHDIGVLLGIREEYTERTDYSLMTEISDETSHLDKMRESLRQKDEEIAFLKSQLKRIHREYDGICNSEPGKMVRKKEAADKKKANFFEDVERDAKEAETELLSLRDSLSELIKTGKTPPEFIPHIIDQSPSGDVPDFLVEEMWQEFLRSPDAKMMKKTGAPEWMLRDLFEMTLQTFVDSEFADEEDDPFSFVVRPQKKKGGGKKKAPPKNTGKKPGSPEETDAFDQDGDESDQSRSVESIRTLLQDEFGFVPFQMLLPEMADGNTSMLEITDADQGIPPGKYVLSESYCSDPECDCRKVMINFIHEKSGRVMATIGYGWESLAFYKKWMYGDTDSARQIHGAHLELGGMQSEYSQLFLRAFRELFVLRTVFREKIIRHYMAFKDEIKQRSVEQQKNGPFIQTGPPIGRNDPCRCGSGQKYKKCCGK